VVCKVANSRSVICPVVLQGSECLTRNRRGKPIRLKKEGWNVNRWDVDVCFCGSVELKSVKYKR
jgi:hypothetical protein